MPNLNKAILIGHCGGDPEVRLLPNGGSVANVSIAVSEHWNDKSGVRQETTEWFRLVFFGKLAEIVEKYVRKGNPIYVEGKFKTSRWTTAEGEAKYSSEVVCRELVMLGGKVGERKEEKPLPVAEPLPGAEPFDDDIPF